MDLAQVFLALAYVIPGFVGYQTYRKCYPAKAMSDTVVVIWSLIHTLVIHVALGCVSSVLGEPRINYLARSPETLGWKSAALLLGSGAVYGLLLVLVHELRLRLNVWPTEPLSIWVKVNR